MILIEDNGNELQRLYRTILIISSLHEKCDRVYTKHRDIVRWILTNCTFNPDVGSKFNRISMLVIQNILLCSLNNQSALRYIFSVTLFINIYPWADGRISQGNIEIKHGEPDRRINTS